MRVARSRSAIRSLFPFVLAAGCVTGGGGEEPDTEEAKAQKAAVSDATMAVPDAVPPDPTIGGHTLGRLADEELRKAIYAGFQTRLADVELGDYDSFQFTVTKLTSGEDDVSADPTQAPDALEIEVTGWYRKSLADGGGDAKSRCFSFDAMAPLVRKGQGWGLPDDYKVAFAREDHEDCY